MPRDKQPTGLANHFQSNTAAWRRRAGAFLATMAMAASGACAPRAAVPVGGSAVSVGGERLLVVAPSAYRAALEEFLRERGRQLGAPVGFLSLEEALAETPAASKGALAPADAPERLKRAIDRRWRRGELTAVLLVGDADVMPVRFMMLDRVADAAFDTAFYPSDLYYADLARDDGSFENWNAACEGVHARYFGEVRGERHKSGPINFDGISYVPEIAVGRWPVSSADEARAVAAKTIRHQDAVRRASGPAASVRGGDASGVETTGQVAFFISGGWIDNSAQARRLFDEVRSSGRWSADLHGFFLPGREPSVAAVAAALAGQPAAVFHTGHGQPWGWEGCFDRATMAAAAACEAPPLLFSIGCSTAVVCTQPPYDAYVDVDGRHHPGTNAGQVFRDFPPPPAPLQPGACNATSVSEEALRRPDGGAIAVIGCVTGSQPCAHTLLDGFVEAMVRDPDASAGRWWIASLARYVRAERLMELAPTDSWYPPSVFFQGMKFVYLGDPTVRIGAGPGARTAS